MKGLGGLENTRDALAYFREETRKDSVTKYGWGPMEDYIKLGAVKKVMSGEYDKYSDN